MTEQKARPFIKWVGGKGQLLRQLENALPQELHDKEFTYIEPFVGGGAMMFFMIQHFPQIQRVVINDINRNLVEAYKNIKHHPAPLIQFLKDLEHEFLSLSSHDAQKEFYLQMRRSFNEDVLSSVNKTALLIFLNRTCFNGLYRENSKGKFNVPFGRYKNPTICNEELIYTDSTFLNQWNVEIYCGDFADTIHHVEEGRLHFFYLDPPYRPLNATSNFNSYVKEGFGDEQQIRLAAFCRELSTRGNCLWMQSNSDCSAKNPQEHFFENIYDGFFIQKVYASRSVNSVASKRGKITELLIRNSPFYAQRTGTEYKTTL